MEGMQHGAIALLDILGWKGVWQRDKDALDKLNAIHGDIRDRAKLILTESDSPWTGPFFSGIQVSVISISDTIAITTTGDLNRAIELATGLSSLLTIRSIDAGLPVRGAISAGYFKAKDNTLVGPAVDEVASWYEHSDCFGTFLTPSAQLQVDRNKFLILNALVEWDLPAKSGLLKGALCGNWPMSWGQGETLEPEVRPALVDNILRLGPLTQEVAGKCMNSLKFFDSVVERQLWSKWNPEHIALKP